MTVDEHWFCTDCGSGPIRDGDEWTEHHAPSCTGKHDPEAMRAAQSRRVYGEMHL